MVTSVLCYLGFCGLVFTKLVQKEESVVAQSYNKENYTAWGRDWRDDKKHFKIKYVSRATYPMSELKKNTCLFRKMPMDFGKSGIRCTGYLELLGPC